MFPYPTSSVRVPPLISNSPYFQPFLLRHAAFPSPLDLSVRTSIPITPPTTPSPPRKRSHPDENDQRGEVPPENQRKNRVSYFDAGSVSSMPMFWKWTQMENAQEMSTIPNSSPSVVRRQPMQRPKNFDYFDCNILESKNDTSSETELKSEGNNAECMIVTDHESDDDSDGFVDVLTQDDDNELPEQIRCSANSETSDSVIEVLIGDMTDGDGEPLDDGPAVSALNRNETVYDDEQLHSAAIEGFAKLFERSVAADESTRRDAVAEHTTVKMRRQIPQIPTDSSLIISLGSFHWVVSLDFGVSRLSVFPHLILDSHYFPLNFGFSSRLSGVRPMKIS